MLNQKISSNSIINSEVGITKNKYTTNQPTSMGACGSHKIKIGGRKKSNQEINKKCLIRFLFIII